LRITDDVHCETVGETYPTGAASQMTEKETFDAAMKKILSVSKPELQRRIEAEKQAKKTAQVAESKACPHF
jgi:hypothetical protein